MIIIRENLLYRRETVKPNSWKLSLHVRPTFSSSTFTYTHTRVLLQFLRLISEKSLSPERRGRPPRRNGSFTKKRKTNIFRMQHSATVYIYFFFHTRAFSKIFGNVYRGYSNSIWKSGSSHGEELAKYPRGINFNKFSSFWQRFNPDVLSETTILSWPSPVSLTGLSPKTSLEKHRGCAYTRINLSTVCCPPVAPLKILRKPISFIHQLWSNLHESSSIFTGGKSRALRNVSRRFEWLIINET